MNKIESGSNQVNQSFSFSLKDKLKRTVALGLTGLALSGPMTGEVRGEQNPMNPPTTTTEKGVMPSQEVEVTDEYRKRISRILTEDFEAPVPVEDMRIIMEDWKQKTFGPYKEELKTQGVEDEAMLDFGAKVLWAWEFNAGGVAHIRNFVSREQILEYTKTKQGLNVYCNKDGDPRILLLNTNKRIDKVFDMAIKWYEENEATDALESIYNNGVCVWVAYQFEPGGYTSILLDEYGVLNPNISEENIKKVKDENFRNGIVRGLFVESYGVAHGQAVRALGISSKHWYVADIEIVKSVLAGKIGEAMGKVNDIYKRRGESFNLSAENFAAQFGVPGGVKSEWIARQVQFLTEAELIDPIGFESWKEVPGMEELTRRKK
jgi:hypothetical protein